MVLYRGHRDAAWRLESPWDRFIQRVHGNQPLELEGYQQGGYLERFKEAAVGLPGVRSADITDDNQWWALGRHHGLITPLLDWTESPFVAAYFAFMDLAESLNPGFLNGLSNPKVLERQEPIVVWRLLVTAGYDRALPELRLIHSRGDGSHRQRVQRGFFTRLVPPNNDRDAIVDPVYRDLEAYLKSRGMEGRLDRFLISGAQTTMALRDLYRMNIRPSTLFPDLVGAAQDANVVHRMVGTTTGVRRIGLVE